MKITPGYCVRTALLSPTRQGGRRRSFVRAPAAIAAAVCLLACPTAAFAAVFQFAVPVATEKGPSTAFLWIPSQAPAVRGVVIGGMTLMEREMAKDACIRQACTAEHLAIVFLKCGLGGADLPRVLDDLAEVSGYGELSRAPLLFVGHSAGGPQAKACATRMHARCFGLVQYRGGTPGGETPLPPGVPALMMLGQFDEFGGTMRDASGRESWAGGRDAIVTFRGRNERNLGSLVVEPGAGHFAWSDRNAEYLALFIRKAAQARIPAEVPFEGKRPPVLREIDVHHGWLADLRIDADDAFEPAPYETYRGEKGRAAWHFDREMAEASVTYHAGGFGKKDQFIQWNDPYWVDAGARFFFTRLAWVGDGQTIRVHPAYATVYPPQHDGRGPRWPDAGQPVGHSSAPIRVRPVSGPVVATGLDTLRWQYDALAGADERSRVTFMAYSQGDAEYRYTEQVGMTLRGFRGIDKGTEQTITFPPLVDVKAGVGTVALRAKSDAGLPVEYYVAHGPAEVDGDKLVIRQLPVRARFPVEVEVVAWQFGRGTEPQVKTALPVSRAFRVTGR